MEVAPDFDEFIGCLTAHGVEFVIVGAYALAPSVVEGRRTRGRRGVRLQPGQRLSIVPGRTSRCSGLSMSFFADAGIVLAGLAFGPRLSMTMSTVRPASSRM